jgi:hypothetical protein
MVAAYEYKDPGRLLADRRPRHWMAERGEAHTSQRVMLHIYATALPKVYPLLPHTARQVGYEHSRPWPDATSTGPRPAADGGLGRAGRWIRSGGGPCTTWIFTVTLSDQRGMGERSPSRRSARFSRAGLRAADDT